MNASILIVSDRFPTTAGAGAESVLSALCKITTDLGFTVDFLVIESPLIAVNLSCTPTGYGNNLTFWQTKAAKCSGDNVLANRLADNVTSFLDLKGYDKIFVFGDDNIILFSRLSGYKIAWPDDPPHLVSEFKVKCNLLTVKTRVRSFLNSINERWMQRILCRALNAYELIVHHAKHHAEEFKNATNCAIIYAPPLIPSMMMTQLLSCKSLGSHRQGFIHIGHLGGAASLASIEMLLSPDLCNHFSQRKQSMVLIGKVDIPKILESKLGAAGYVIKGFVKDLESAMRSCRAVVVPGNYSVGARTRILHALSLGTPVIAHRSCGVGIPELQSCGAVEMFDSPQELVCILMKYEALDEDLLGKISATAIEFMMDFAPKVELKWKNVFTSIDYSEYI